MQLLIIALERTVTWWVIDKLTLMFEAKEDKQTTPSQGHWKFCYKTFGGSP